ncbi:MAG: hypothetical protein NVS3B16_25190 [Vulcanimicrobiaceae bacterium]
MSSPVRGGGLRPLRASLDHWSPSSGREPDPLHAIAAAWPGIVGPDVAANASPLEIAGEALVVGTRSSAWSQQLQFLSLPILEGLRALPSGGGIERLTFRTGLAPRTRKRWSPVPATVRRRPRGAAPDADPAASLEAAFARLRRRMSARTRPHVTCQACGIAIEPPATERRGPAALPLRCAPCAGEAERARRIAVERIVYMAPWLTVDELRGELPDLSVAEFERARKALLARWWLTLERVRLSGRVSAGGLERHVGSSYVLLQSRLPPDRITPAVVRNLLGADLEKLLWPHSVGAAGAKAAT